MSDQESASSNILFALIGAAITAISITLYYIMQGRIVNLTQEIWRIIYWRRTTVPQSLAFIGGLLVAAGVCFDWIGYNNFNGIQPYGKKQNLINLTSIYGFALSGFLIGIGSQVIAGDLFAHGYCGVGKKNKRSVAALIIFILSGIIGGILSSNNYIPFLTDGSNNIKVDIDHALSANICIVIGVLLLIGGFFLRKGDFNNTSEVIKQMAIAFFFSFLIGVGVLISGLSRRINVIKGFGVVGGQWSPILLIIIATTVLLCFILFLSMGSMIQRPLFGQDFFSMNNQIIDLKFVLGSIAFGFGWGLSGLEMVSFILHFAVFTIPIGLFFGLFMFGGMYIWHFISQIK